MRRKNGGDRRIVSELRVVRGLTKYGIVCMAIQYGLHNVMVLMGIDHHLLHFVGAAMALSVGWKLSSIFGLCATHRICVLYMCVAEAVAVHVEHTGYTPVSDALQVTLVFCGVLLTIMLMIVCVDRRS